eukprot:CAMPEP_0117847512 /NCGR_PEP_ID=MMETSP0949-20121206/19771_1 /TAXON_ID=44440 /ORGANISM="Chattonella subsalsa, Strain CCMP2191" /LENGTH=38 /DNA_ID= /DNA_START= /DNA_END= /DNA_ORIENTATION=
MGVFDSWKWKKRLISQKEEKLATMVKKTNTADRPNFQK